MPIITLWKKKQLTILIINEKITIKTCVLIYLNEINDHDLENRVNKRWKF